MATKKLSKLELARDLFLALAPRWDLKDRATAKHLALACFESAEGFLDAADEVETPLMSPKAPKAKALEV
jgi:hypothetical protein